jgi:WD40 repeat protein
MINAEGGGMPRRERPLDVQDGPLAEFAADLRRLREQAGSPTYRQLSTRANFSVSVLSQAAAGRKLPSLAATLAYVRACDGDVPAWESRWRKTSAQLTGVHCETGVDSSGRAPYIGLSAFRSRDSDLFFGRDALVAELMNRLGERRFVGVFGASGSGKSSLLQAGLIAGISSSCPVVIFTPGAHPIEECAVGLAALTGQSPALLRDEFAASPESLHLRVRQAVAGEPEAVDAVIVIDQFEEVFTLCADHDERARFIDSVVFAATAETSRARVVIGVRADFYGHCGEHPQLVEALRDAQVLVGPMTPDELRTAITQPAIRAGCKVETALVARLVADAVGQQAVLPLVSHALLETWRRRRGVALTVAGYEATGGIQDAIARTAEEAYAALDAGQQAVARQLFLRLTSIGDEGADTKRRATRAELDSDDPGTSTVLEHLARARLLTLDRDTVEITHEALIRNWPRLRGWLAEDRGGLRLHHQLAEAAAAWESLNHDPGALYRGTRLALTREWTATSRSALTPRERAFLDASLAVAAQEQGAARRRTRRLRQLVALLAVLLVLAAATTVHAVRVQQDATRQRDTALSEKVAGEAVALRVSNPGLAAQLGLASYRLAPTTAAHDGLLSTFAVQLSGHRREVYSLAFSPDGGVLATASGDRTVRLWNVRDANGPAELATITGNEDSATFVRFSPDGRVLATAGRDRTIRLWDVADLRHVVPLATLTGHEDTVFSLAFSPDGRHLASGGYDHTVRLWDITNLAAPTQLSVPARYSFSVKPVVFSPDGRVLAVGTDDHQIRLWDVRDPVRPVLLSTLSGHTYSVDTLAFDPSGRTLASGSDDHTVRLWDVHDPLHPSSLAVAKGHTDVVGSVAFSGDGRTLVSGGYDHTVRLWNASDPAHPSPLATLSGHDGSVESVALNPDGHTLASASADRTAQLWDTDFRHQLDHACDHARPAITPAEWDHYFPGVDYQPPCGTLP